MQVCDRFAFVETVCFTAELQKQTYRIVVTMDAFGNPLGFANDVLDGLQDLVFDGNVGGFVSGFGYGVTNSISKVCRLFKLGGICFALLRWLSRWHTALVR